MSAELGVTFNNKENNMDWMDAEELAVAVLGLDEDTANSETVENAMYEKFEISMEQFSKVADALIPFTIPAKAAISEEAFHGFVKDGAFICKQLVTPNVKVRG